MSSVVLGSMFVFLVFSRARSTGATVLLRRNLVTSIGAVVASAGLVMLMVVPIWMSNMPDGGTLWCGTFVMHWSDCPGCCESHGLYDRRWDDARWFLLGGIGLILIGLVCQCALNTTKRCTTAE
jgi:hypothetical protein